jgi:hypothetical protein
MKQFSTGVEGRPKIARRFNAGNRHSERHPVPEGRLNPRRQSRPSSQTRIISSRHERESSRTGSARIISNGNWGTSLLVPLSPGNPRALAPEVNAPTSRIDLRESDSSREAAKRESPARSAG